MSSFEIESVNYNYEVFLHSVNLRHGVGNESYCDVPEAGLEPVKTLLESDTFFKKDLAWIDLSRKAEVNIRHSEQRDKAPYRLPNYPQETIYGHRIFYADSYFVTDRNDSELEFTPFTEVYAQAGLSEYMGRWMGAIASRNHFPVFWTKLSGRVSNAMIEASRNHDYDNF